MKLSQLFPLLKRAQQSINILQDSSRNIVDIKSSKRLHQLLSLLFDCVAILFHLKLCPIVYIPQLQISKNITVSFWKNSYEQSGRFIMGPNFDIKRKLIQFEKDYINGQTIQLLEPLLLHGSYWFNQKQLSKISKAGESLCVWVYSIYNYYHKIQPIKRQMDELKKFEQQVGVKIQQLDKQKAQLKEYQSFYKCEVSKISENIQNQAEKLEIITKYQ